MKNLLLHAKAEIESLRRRNEILGAQVDVLNLFRTALSHGNNPNTCGMAIDIALELERAAESFDRPTPTPPDILSLVRERVPHATLGNYNFALLLDAVGIDPTTLTGRDVSRVGRFLRTSEFDALLAARGKRLRFRRARAEYVMEARG